jgi:hypothetical protein
MKLAILQAVIEVLMSYRQAKGAIGALCECCREFGLKRVELSGYSVLRGLTFTELQLGLDEGAELQLVSQAALTYFIVAAEGLAQRGESDEFALVFAEAFWTGRDYEPEAVFLPVEVGSLGIGGVDQREDDVWAGLLSRYYNPPARRPNEIRFRRTKLEG